VGRSAPANQAIVQIAHQIERREIAPGVENMRILLKLAGL
jgi:2-dehydropantoate 2-reductase